MSARNSTASPTFGPSLDDDVTAFDGSANLIRAWSRGIRPDPDLTVSEWADRHRWLSSRASAEPGRYRTARTPHMREIMDALFRNTVLGETWMEIKETHDWQRLSERRETWKAGTLPARGLFLTAGADVQKDRIEVDVWAWGRGLGGFNRASPVTGPTYVDVTVGGKLLRRGARLWSVATSTFKSETYRFLRQDRPKPEEIAAGVVFPTGTVHLPPWSDAEWLKQLTAEQLVTVKGRSGFTWLEWQKLRERNEALDCRVYACAAAWIAGADRWSEARSANLEGQLGVAKRDEPGPGAAPRTEARTAPRRRTMRSSYMG